ncbi:hypothetical protein ACFY0Z_26020 [Streptomyces kronopolitis]|uniref:hypothetical protein n=1 Tax=Streptomyces kronopolitis TaxID=1612435 RepID=UPI003691384A
MDVETESDTKKKEKRIDLSVAQVSGSALAAAAAAYLAGQLGVYGTIIGAGVVSVVATTGGSIFQHLFRRTGEQIKEASVITRPKPRRFSAARGRSGTPDAPPPASTMVLPTFDRQGTEDEVASVAARTPGPDAARTQLFPRADASGTRDPEGADDATRMLRAVDSSAPGEHASDRTAPERPTDRTQLVPRLDERTAMLGAAARRPVRHPAGAPETLSTATYGTRLRGWKRPALGALAVFALAMGTVTVTEMITGQTANGEQGTSLGNIVQTGGSGRHQPSTPQSPEPGNSPDDGKRHGNSGEPSPDPSPSDSTGTGKDKGKGDNSPSPDPSPSGGGQPSSDPGTPSPTPSTSGSSGGGATGKGDGSTGGDTSGGSQQQRGSGGRDPAPGAP